MVEAIRRAAKNHLMTVLIAPAITALLTISGIAFAVRDDVRELKQIVPQLIQADDNLRRAMLDGAAAQHRDLEEVSRQALERDRILMERGQQRERESVERDDKQWAVMIELLRRPQQQQQRSKK